MERAVSYHPARHEKQRISAIMGATGCVMMNWGHPENTAVPFGGQLPSAVPMSPEEQLAFKAGTMVVGNAYRSPIGGETTAGRLRFRRAGATARRRTRRSGSGT